MTSGQPASVEDSLRTLWTGGAIGGADDAMLIARFAEQRDEAAEVVFRVLVERHGPMVVRVCEQVLGDRDAAHEAAQAVFLVLARKAGSIRVGTTVAPWLYGVARRVASRARARAASRHAREERTARTAAALRIEADTTGGLHPEDWEAIHEEVGRLPEKYRVPVVLCYLEGLTYEDAARRIGCPVGTVRARLSRARDRLRDRLSRRGFGPERVAVIGSLADGPARAVLPAPGVGAGWVDATVKSAQAYIAGRAAAAGVVPALTLALGDEVVRSLAMYPWKLVMLALLALGATSTVAVGIAASGGGSGQGGLAQGQNGAPVVAAESPPTKKEALPVIKDLPEPVEVMIPKQASRLRAAAAQRLDAQRAFYGEGRITIDRYIDAIRGYIAARMEQATTREERIIAAQIQVELLDEVVKKEKEELDRGQTTVADVAESHVARESAALELLKIHKPPAPENVVVLQKRVETLEKQLERVMKHPALKGIDVP